MKSKKITFQRDSQTFILAVKKRVDEYFAKTKTAKEANGILHIKSLLLFLCCLFLYSVILMGFFLYFPRPFLFILFGINQTLIALNIGHDALHNAYSTSSFVNTVLGYLAYDCIGISSYVWKQTHNMEHHVFTNIYGMDPDIDKPTILRLSPHDPKYFFHRYQHLYCWFLYALIGPNWVFFGDYRYIWDNRRAVSRRVWLIFLLFKLFNLTWVFLILGFFSPLTVGQLLLGVLLMHLAGGFTAAVIFQLAHVVENVDFPLPNAEGKMRSSWGAHEMATTANFATDSLAVTYMIGGLNFQIEHHLLPQISHCHYPEIAKIVRKLAKEHGLPYHEQPTLFSAIASHARFLKKLGGKKTKNLASFSVE